MNVKQKTAVILDILILATAVVCAVLTYTYLENARIKAALYILCFVSGAGILAWEGFCRQSFGKQKPFVQSEPVSLVLLSEHDRTLRVWQLSGQVSLLVGKSRDEVQADVDLQHTEWNEAIDPAHLALNYVENGWWAEDLSSRNGSTIVREGRDIALSPGWPVQLKMNDVILLAGGIRLAVR